MIRLSCHPVIRSSCHPVIYWSRPRPKAKIWLVSTRDDADRAYFLTLLARYRQRFTLRIYHYCLMPNHFHVLAQIADCRELSAFMAGLLRSYLHYFNRRYGFVGNLFQGRFKRQRRQQLWREFLLGDDPNEQVVRRSDWIIGDDNFRQRMEHAADRPAPRRRGRPRKPKNGDEGTLFPELIAGV